MIVLVLLAACTGGRERDSSAAHEPDVTMLNDVDMTAFSLPLDQYMLSDADIDQINHAIARLSAPCIESFGFEAQPPEQPDNSAWPRERLYGIHDVSQARRLGYRPAPQAAEPREPSEPTAQEAVVLSCRLESARDFYGPDSDGSTAMPWALPMRLSMQASDEAKNDSRLKAAFADWSACMWRAGFDYADPWAANDDPTFATSEPSHREIAVATADATCKVDVDVIDLWSSIETAYQNRIIEQYADELALVLAELDRTRQRSAGILAA